MVQPNSASGALNAADGGYPDVSLSYPRGVAKTDHD